MKLKSTPAAIIFKERALRNINRMVEKASKSTVSIRPHFKTHQSPTIGRWFSEKGIDKITVSSVQMAVDFADHGWNDILISGPVNLLESPRLNSLSSKVVLHVCVDSLEACTAIIEKITSPITIWLDINTGHNRTGIEWSDKDTIIKCAKAVMQSKHVLGGVIAHAGHSYKCRDRAEIRKVYTDTASKLTTARQRLVALDVPNPKISIGDTPTCMEIDDFSQVDEIRPGNFVFFDLMQLQIGSCKEEDIAIAVTATVVSKSSVRNEIVVHAGKVHLSCDFIEIDGQRCYGKVALIDGVSLGPIQHGMVVTRIFQEHAVISVEPSALSQINIGDVIGVIPVHSCLVMNCFKVAQLPTGELIPTF